MKQCLNCKKDFEPKKDTAKYCSVSCRVMWNRKKEKKESKVQMQTIYNAILDLIDKGVLQSAHNYPTAVKKEKSGNVVLKVNKNVPVDHEAELTQRIVLCETVSEAKKISDDISNCMFLTAIQKASLQKTLKEFSKEFYND